MVSEDSVHSFDSIASSAWQKHVAEGTHLIADRKQGDKIPGLGRSTPLTAVLHSSPHIMEWFHQPSGWFIPFKIILSANTFKDTASGMFY
jgi:hypothetical protein